MAQKSEDVSHNSKMEFTSLQDVLYSFNNSINEEQAWAVCYQCAQYLEQNPSQDCFRDLYYYGISAIRLSKEGDVKIEMNFSQGTGKGPPSPKKRSSFSLSREFKTVINQTDVIQALGTAIYKALDFGLSESEEPHLSSELEALIESLTDHPNDDDEGIDIERDSDQDIDDSQGKERSVFQDIIDSCKRRLSKQQNAQVHYTAVCRALATEATELATFLDNIAKGQEKLASTSKDDQPSVDDLERADWARLWVQIMRDLRHGVRLKKVEQVHLPPMEYELTPFEILLEDIRLGRYKLNSIMVNRRMLKERPKPIMDPRELLMIDICKPHKLKPVRHGKRVVRKPTLDCDTNYSSDEDGSPKPVRKVIKPVSAFQVSTDDSDSSPADYDEDYSNHINQSETSSLNLTYPHSDSANWKRAVTRDLAQQPSSKSCSVSRRHTISACDLKSGKKHKWQNPIECLSLTLEEVTHIRCVLTKAELESLITQPELHSQVSKGKVCFTCKKTKFSLFGQWGTKCKFCQRTVCNYCLRKMSVPTEHFEKVPVYTLSPVPLSPEVLEALKIYESTGSVPHSPVTNRKTSELGTKDTVLSSSIELGTSIDKSLEEPASVGTEESKAASRRKSLQRSHTIGVGVGSRPPPNKALLRGPQMSICCECKSMIMEIIRASRSSVSLITGRPEPQTDDKPSSSPTPQRQMSTRSAVVTHPRLLDTEERPRPKSMLENFKSFNFSKQSSSDA